MSDQPSKTPLRAASAAGPTLSAYAPTTWGRYTLAWGTRTFVMGILNITPDSFSLDGLALEGATQDEIIRHAITKGQQMVADGADLIDVGGESTRPVTEGAAPLDPAIERARVIPVITALAAALPAHIPLSIDTYKASVAEAALDAGAALVNDIWGLRADPHLAALIAARGVPVVIMSNLRGAPRHDPARPLADVMRQLAGSLERALGAGIPWDHIILDPGIGFGLVGAENLRVLAELGALRALGRPLLVGTSRKSHIGLVLGAPVEDRLEGSAATVALSIAQGADIVRVHDVREMARVARMSDAIVRGWPRE
ncbi:MAG TPA: dihydropteroate synthase [Ktedonobacterales bacterium]|nr:dihydropteroate synthase [Ktedonobacterales bacterium]